MNYLETYNTMIEMRGLAEHTRRSYKTYISAYLKYLNNLAISPEDATWDLMRDYIKSIKSERKLNDRTINAAISQLRFFTIYVLHKSWDETQLPFRKFDTYLPYVPSRQDVASFINSIDDSRFKAMVALMYSAGLRVGEVCNLKYDDISRANKTIHIRSAKNRHDRYAVLSDYALELLTDYWFEAGKPTGYLFHQINKDAPVDTFNVCRHIQSQEAKLGWEHKFTPHTFRHAFATHLYEDTHDIVLVKTLLGHRSINSTTVYIHLASIDSKGFVNPLDKLLMS